MMSSITFGSTYRELGCPLDLNLRFEESRSTLKQGRGMVIRGLRSGRPQWLTSYPLRSAQS